MLLRAEIHREIAHRRLQRRFGHAHDIVVRHARVDPPNVGQRQHRAAIRHQRGGARGRLGEGEARDHHGADEILARRVGVATLQFVLVGEGDRMNQEVDACPIASRASRRPRRREARSSTSQGITNSEPTDLRQRLDALAERLALIGEGEFGAVAGERPGDAPGDRVVVRNPHDQAALALHQHRTSRAHSVRRPVDRIGRSR